jgi:hypothetical protein
MDDSIMMKKVLCIFILFIVLTHAVFTQSEDSDDNSRGEIPPPMSEQSVCFISAKNLLRILLAILKRKQCLSSLLTS